MKKILTLPFLILLFTVLTGMPINYTFAISDLDHDGVDDAVDACPNLSEDNEGAIDGCPSNFVPWYDEDFDGIEDHIDQCPNIKENYNKFQDEDGCPDSVGDSNFADTDNDGIQDSIDLCPEEPENYNEYRDTDGCPDVSLNS